MTAVVAPYRFKPSPYSSHSLLLAALPAAGGGRRVLDVGCGPGYLAEFLAGRGYSVTGIDSPGRLADAPAGIEVLEADLDRDMPPLGAAFDYIVCADVLEHLRDPAALLRDLRGRLAAGGRLLASLPNSGHAYFRWNVLMGRFPAHDRGLFDRTHLRFYTWRGWLELFAAAGFAFESVRVTGVPVGLALPRWEHSAPVRAAEWLSFQTARVWKTLFAYQFVVTAVPR